MDIFEEEQEFELSSDVIRAIEVPFETFEGIDTEVASTADSEVISIPSGKYNLRCEFLGNINEQTPRIRLVFEKTNRIRFAILRADERLSLPENLVTCAEPVTP